MSDLLSFYTQLNSAIPDAVLTDADCLHVSSVLNVVVERPLLQSLPSDVSCCQPQRTYPVRGDGDRLFTSLCACIGLGERYRHLLRARVCDHLTTLEIPPHLLQPYVTHSRTDSGF